MEAMPPGLSLDELRAAVRSILLYTYLPRVVHHVPVVVPWSEAGTVLREALDETYPGWASGMMQPINECLEPLVRAMARAESRRVKCALGWLNAPLLRQALLVYPQAADPRDDTDDDTESVAQAARTHARRLAMVAFLRETGWLRAPLSPLDELRYQTVRDAYWTWQAVKRPALPMPADRIRAFSRAFDAAFWRHQGLAVVTRQRQVGRRLVHTAMMERIAKPPPVVITLTDEDDQGELVPAELLETPEAVAQAEAEYAALRAEAQAVLGTPRANTGKQSAAAPNDMDTPAAKRPRLTVDRRRGMLSSISDMGTGTAKHKILLASGGRTLLGSGQSLVIDYHATARTFCLSLLATAPAHVTARVNTMELVRGAPPTVLVPGDLILFHTGTVPGAPPTWARFEFLPAADEPGAEDGKSVRAHTEKKNEQ